MAIKVFIPALIQALGGKENLAQATHCATRLRVTTRDKSKIDEAALKAIPGVLGVVNNGTQTQIIIGAEVNNVYKDFIAQAGVDEEAPIDENLDLKDELKNKKGKLLTRFFETVAAIFNPIVPALAGCGFLSALICIFMALGFDSSAPTFKTIIAISMVYTIYISRQLAEGEKSKVELYKKVLESLNDPENLNKDISFETELINSNILKNIPVIFVDESGVIYGGANWGSARDTNMVFLQKN